MNALDTLGQTALHRAAMAGHLQTCRMLLSYGADASILSLQGFTASQMGNEAVQQILSGTERQQREKERDSKRENICVCLTALNMCGSVEAAEGRTAHNNVWKGTNGMASNT